MTEQFKKEETNRSEYIRNAALRAKQRMANFLGHGSFKKNEVYNFVGIDQLKKSLAIRLDTFDGGSDDIQIEGQQFNLEDLPTVLTLDNGRKFEVRVSKRYQTLRGENTPREYTTLIIDPCSTILSFKSRMRSVAPDLEVQAQQQHAFDEAGAVDEIAERLNGDYFDHVPAVDLWGRGVRHAN